MRARACGCCSSSTATTSTRRRRGPRAFRPDVVLVDIGLPGMNGYDVARAIRSHAHGAHARLIALTGYGQEEDRRGALAAGFDRHLTKPVDYDVLKQLLADGALKPDDRRAAD